MTKKFELGKSTKERSKKPILLLIGLVIALLAAVSVYWFAIRDTSPAVVDGNATDPTINSSKELSSNESSTKSSSASGTESTSNSEDIPVSTALAVTGIKLSQESGFVNASAQISGSTQAGTCVFSFTATDSRPVVKEASATSDCSIKIAEVEFDKIGEWNLSVTFYQQNTKATAEQKVTIN